MTLNEVLTTIQPTGARVVHKEPDSAGDGWVIYIGRRDETIFPFALAHCIQVHVSDPHNPELHPAEVNAILRRFASKKGPARVP